MPVVLRMENKLTITDFKAFNIPKLQEYLSACISKWLRFARPKSTYGWLADRVKLFPRRHMKQSVTIYSSGKSLFDSRHVKEVRYHYISEHLSICYIMCTCIPEQRVNNPLKKS